MSGETLSVADVLRKALEAFGPNGEHWAKGDAAVGERSCCVVTSFNRVRLYEYRDASIALLKQVGNIATPMARWNDAPERTFAEVKALFEKAISKAGDQ